MKDISKYPLACGMETKGLKCYELLSYAFLNKHLGPKDLQMYDRFSVQASLVGDSKLKPFFCPNRDCNMLMALDRMCPAAVSCDTAQVTVSLKGDLKENSISRDESTSQKCVACGFLACVRCEAPFHTGQSCEAFQLVRAGPSDATLRLEQLASQRQWCKCPKCGTLIERSGGCNHMTHLRAHGCLTSDEATHFCSQCFMQLGGPHHKSEPDGTLHYPEGLFKDCRVTLAKDPSKITKNYDPDGTFIDEDAALDRVWRTSLCSCCSVGVAPACLSLCCPCLAGAVGSEGITGRSPLSGCCCYCCCCPCYAPYVRSKVRSMFGISGYLCCDMLTSWFCFCCAVLQEAQEIESRTNEPHRQVMH